MLFHLLTHGDCLFWPSCTDSECQVMNKIMFNTVNILGHKFLAQHKYRHCMWQVLPAFSSTDTIKFMYL